MKKLIMAVVLTSVLVAGAGFLGSFHVSAQATQPSIGLTFASTLSGCQAVGQNTLCFFGSSTAPSAAVSIGGGAFVALNAPPPSAGVTSFNTRTGAVAPAANDYSFNQISGSLTAGQMPASQKCSLTFTLAAPTSGTVTNQLSGVAQIAGCQ